jgi:hypothetical protein
MRGAVRTETSRRRRPGADLPADGDRVPFPDLGEFWDFDDEEELRRRLPRLAALFLEPPEEWVEPLAE